MKFEKHRYIVFKVFSNQEISQNELIKGIWRSINELFGEKGASATGLWVIDFDIERGIGTIRCNLKSLNLVKVALILLTKIKTTQAPVMIKIKGVSGTIKGSKEKFY